MEIQSKLLALATMSRRVHASLLLLAALACCGAQAATGEASMEVAFSPNGEATELVIKGIDSARESIRVSSYSFTSQPIAAALVRAHERGIDVKVLMDKSQKSQRASSAGFLARMGVPLRIDGRHAIHHNKFLIIDDRHVETGSFNYTAAAQRSNAENVLMLWNNPALALRYAGNWQLHWQHAEAYVERY